MTGRECTLELETEGYDKYRIELEKSNELAKVDCSQAQREIPYCLDSSLAEGQSGVWHHATTGDHQLLGDVELQRTGRQFMSDSTFLWVD